MGKYGKKNEVKLNPLKYNIALLGEAKIGKTTIVKQICEELVGDDGYLFLEMGKEDGADAIQGINYINCPEYSMNYDEATNSAGFEDVVDDIIARRTTEYKDLKVVVIDTFDQAIEVMEQEAIDSWNRESTEKQCKSINSAWGGYMKGQDKAMEIFLDKLWELKRVGISFIVIGHVKTKDVTDIVTGETYQTLTSDIAQRYFSALKNKLHFLGLAYIDRTIVREKTGKKNPTTKKEETVGKVTGQARKIKFRDDNFCVDSGSRFADIVDEVEFTPTAFINALTDAIKREQSKSGKTLEETEKEQKEAEAKRMKEVQKAEEQKKNAKALSDVVGKITAYIKANKSDMEKITPILAKSKELGYANPMQIDKYEDAMEVLSIIE